MTEQIAQCERCRRRLKDPESIARKIGPTCERRRAWEKGDVLPTRVGRKAKRPTPPLQTGPDLFDAAGVSLS